MKKANGVFIGFLFIVVGLLYACSALDFFDFTIFFPGWWTLFIIVPCLYALTRKEEDKTGPAIGLIVGICFLINAQDFDFHIDFFPAALAVLCIVIGWKLIVPQKKREHKQVDVELICDGIHVHPSTVRNTFRIFGDDRVVLISDSMRAAGMEDGNYTLGGQDVIVKGALATLADGTIAGSATNLYDCMKKAVSMGISRESAIKAATINPARSIGIDTVVGSLEAGKQADFLIVDQDLNLQSVILGGRVLEE